MKREILFRGKIQGIIDWVYGFYAKSGEMHCILFDTESEDNYSLVDESTVGQYTGLTDKNGTKIFEGDILKIQSTVRGEEPDAYTGALLSCGREDYAVVLHDTSASGCGGYRLKVYHAGKYKRISKFSYNNLFAYKAEVIGNIHDNPELLTEKE